MGAAEGVKSMTEPISESFTHAMIMTAELAERLDQINGTVRVYSPGETHVEADVWRGEVPAPDGVWITRCGNWRVVRCEIEQIDVVERNLCYCPFCKSCEKHQQKSLFSSELFFCDGQASK
jgi:hypothetical protein